MVYSFIVTGLNKKKTCNFCQKLAKVLDMHFLDVEALFEYSIISKKDALDKCGKAYLDREEKKTVLSSLEFENTVLFMTYDILVNHIELLKNHKIFYFFKELKDCSGDPLLELVFEERDGFLRKNSDLLLSGTEQNMMKNIKEYLKGATT